MIRLKNGEVVPLVLTLEDKSPSESPMVTILSSVDSVLITIPMIHGANGTYFPQDKYVMPSDWDFITAVYDVPNAWTDDNGVKVPKYFSENEVFYLEREEIKKKFIVGRVVETKSWEGFKIGRVK